MDHFTQRVYLVGRITPGAVQLLGTAFALGKDGHFATSRHVVGRDPSKLVILMPNISSVNEYQDVSDDNCKPVSVSVVDINPFVDLAILHAPGHAEGEILGLETLDKVHVGEQLEIYGFPHSVDGRRVFTYQSAILGAKVLLSSNGLKFKHGVINSQTRPGQSGSLVYSRRLHKIVGMLQGTYIRKGGSVTMAGVDATELNQTSHIVSAEYISEMLR